MKRLFTLLTFLLCILALNAQQPREMSVVPGSKGPLPELPVLPPLEGNHIAGLTLTRVCFHQWSWYDAYEADIYFPTFPAEEAEYCTLQKRPKSTGAWETITNSDGTPYHYKSAALVTPEITEDTDFRIVLHNGTKDGYTSNVVSAKMPTVHYTFIQQSHYFTMVPYVGQEYTGSWVEALRKTRTWNYDRQRYDYTTAEQCYTYNTNYYRRQWYRLNPNTTEMFPIEGATGDKYTPTMEDLGYELMEVIEGDDIHCSYYCLFGHGIVTTYIQASVDYIGNDGFVLNTDYILPEGGKDLRVFGQNENWETFEVAHENIHERKPGQYVVYTPVDGEVHSYYDVTYQIDDIWDTGDYALQFNRGTEDNPGLRPVQIYYMMYEQPIVVKSSTNEPVEAWGQNIDGEWGFKETLDASQLTEEEPYFTILWGKLILKAPGTATTLPTYYPDALLWSDAQVVESGADYDEHWNMIPYSFTIEAVAKPAPLTGAGTISGAVAMSQPSATARHAASAYGQMVYLKQVGGDVVAYAETDATGSYSFQNVPDGSYQVLVNIDGCIMEEAIEVTLSAGNRNISNIDYFVEGSIIKRDDPDSIEDVHSSQSRVHSEEAIYNLAGQKIVTSRLPRGINIIRHSDGTTRKVLIK